MDYQGTRDTYVIRFSPRGLEDIVNMSLHSRQHLVMILKDDPDANLIGNPVRSLVVDSVLRKHRGPFEIWEVESPLTEEEIQQEFWKCPDQIKTEVRESGQLIYMTE